jgi:ABC-type tungstate transport system substrate-binding protein
LSTVAPCGADFAVTWLAIMPSVIDRRPKGVVEICVCIFLYLLLGKENPLAETALSLEKLLTVILGSAILSTCQD